MVIPNGIICIRIIYAICHNRLGYSVIIIAAVNIKNNAVVRYYVSQLKLCTSYISIVLKVSRCCSPIEL